MKNKILFKLIMYFSASLLLFSIVIGSVFIALFKNHTLNLHKSDLEKRAVTISGTLSEIMSNNNSINGNGMMGRMGGYGAYVRMLDDIAMADVWIVDENLELITIGHAANQQYNYSDMPEDADAIVREVFKGKTTFGEGFSELLNEKTLTVGTPILADGKVAGALLIHSPVNGMNDATGQGFKILIISMIFALLLSIILSAALAVYFTKPLKKMKDAAIELSSGNYMVKTGVSQHDEIGELAGTIDILSDRLHEASLESEKLDNLRKGFIANISHELRTPVTVIRGSLEALYDGVVSEPKKVKEYYGQMLKESRFLERLVNDLLDLSRLQNSDFKIEMNDLNLCDVLNDAVRSARNLAREKNIDIKYFQDSSVLFVEGDYDRLRQMFLIIIENAIKFSVANAFIEINLVGRTVNVKDMGEGINKEDLPYIFDRFYKVKSESNKDGTGLGLSIAKQIAERHNVIVSVSSEENRGTEFSFLFPIEKEKKL